MFKHVSTYKYVRLLVWYAHNFEFKIIFQFIFCFIFISYVYSIWR